MPRSSAKKRNGLVATQPSFGRPVTRLAELREAVASYTARAAEKRRRQCLHRECFQAVGVIVRSNRHFTAT